MKKIFSLFITMCLVLSLFTGVAFADEGIRIEIFGKSVSFDQMPVNIDGRVLVPMRGIFETLGAEIEWREDLKSVTATKGGKKVVVTIDSPDAYIDGIYTAMDVVPRIIQGRTMVPVRFVSEAMGENVDWDDATKTVIVTGNKNSGLKKLASDFHRPVPSEFTKSNAPDDLIYYDKSQYTSYREVNSNLKNPDDVYKAITAEGKEILGIDDVKNGVFSNSSYGTIEVTTGEDGNNIIKIKTDKMAAKSGDCIYRMDEVLKGKYNEGDVCLLVVTMRTVSGGDENGVGKIQLQTEEPKTFKKDIWEEVSAGGEWSTHYFAYIPDFSKGERYNFGIRPAFYKQEIEIKEFKIINYGKNVRLEDMPVMEHTLEQKNDDIPNWEDFEKEAEWRKAKLDSIEKNRKGDFNIFVVDKGGNPIEGAEVELDMFEHEFEIGNAMNGSIINNEDYRSHAISLFNSAVLEHNHKWAPYEENPDNAKKQVDAIFGLGIKKIRGHSIFWERSVGSDGNTYLTPEYVFSQEMKNPANKHLYDEKAKAHTYHIINDHIGTVSEWDVINEIVGETKVRDVFGPEIYKDAFRWAREAGGLGMKLYYNEALIHDPKFIQRLDELATMNADFDAIGLQSHYDKANRSMEEISNLYKTLYEKYGKELKVTEYSCAVDDIYLQAAFTRDMLITAFADPNISGFIMWGFWDGANFAGAKSPVYDKEWNLKPAGEQIVDLLYNKWWTRDAKAVCANDGKATVRGFYGDYDVTVNANGKTVTEMVSFHKGYDNTLTIVIE